MLPFLYQVLDSVFDGLITLGVDCLKQDFVWVKLGGQHHFYHGGAEAAYKRNAQLVFGKGDCPRPAVNIPKYQSRHLVAVRFVPLYKVVKQT